MTDIFHDWKEKRFIVVDKSLLDNDDIIILLTDMDYWIERTDDIKSWCRDNNCTQSGLTVTVPSEKELLLFCLKWC